jgi:drug/metabolite transporter (DMT)-like permease
MTATREQERTGEERAGPGPRFTATDGMLLMMALIWGVNFSVIKHGTEVMDPLAFNGIRVALAAVALLAITATLRGGALSRRDLLVLLALGVLGNGVYQLLFIEGIARTRAGNAALVMAATPAFIALLGRMLRVERVVARGWFGIALSIGGIALVVFGAAERVEGEGHSTLVGNLLVLGGSLSWALFTVLLKPITQRVDALRISALTMVGGAVPLVLVASPALAATDWSAVGAAAWGAIIYSGIGALVIAYLFWYRGVRTLGPTRTAMYGNLQPMIALFVAWLALSEVPTMWQWIGAVTIIAGVLLTRR